MLDNWFRFIVTINCFSDEYSITLNGYLISIHLHLLRRCAINWIIHPRMHHIITGIHWVSDLHLVHIPISISISICVSICVIVSVCVSACVIVVLFVLPVL